jgi:hypothetical protein
MDDDSLTNFIVSMNRRFRRSQFLFDKSIKLRFYSAVECCLSYFKTLGVLERSFSRKFGAGDVLWAIGVHEASAADEPIAGESRTGGVVNFYIHTQPGKRYDFQSLSQGRSQPEPYIRRLFEKYHTVVATIPLLERQKIGIFGLQ